MSSREFGPDAAYPIDVYRDLDRIGIERVHALDYDRTLADSDLAVRRLSVVAVKYGIPDGILEETVFDAEQGGSTSEPYSKARIKLKEVHGSGWEAAFEALRQDFRNDTTTPILYNGEYDDAAVMLDELQGEPPIPSLLATSAADLVWQHDKVEPVWGGYTEYSHVLRVTDPDTGQIKSISPTKGGTTASWRGPDGTFDFVAVDKDNRPLVLVSADTISQLDDKPTVFGEDFPADCEAILIRRPGEKKRLTQSGKLPEHIIHRQVIQRLGDYTLRREQAFDEHPLATQVVAFVPAIKWAAAGRA